MFRHRCISVVVPLLIAVGASCTDSPQSRELFNRALTAGASATSDTQWYIFSEIAKAEAEQAYYNDAIEAWKLTDRWPDLLLADIVRIRAENGDISGARNMAQKGPSAEAKFGCLREIALVQVKSGDISGAIETTEQLPSRFRQSVLEAIGVRQAESGDLDAALATAKQMQSGWSDSVLFAVADKLSERGNTAEAHKVASRITNKEMAESVGAPEVTPSINSSDACDIAWQEAKSGNSEGALRALEKANCQCKTLAYIHQHIGDIQGAELALRNCDNPADLSAGMAELAKRSAQSGDIPTALRLAGRVHVTGAYFEEEYLADAFRYIGRNWGGKDRTAAIKWAESTPVGFPRAMALLGVAESYRCSPSGERKNTQVPPPPPPPARTADR